MIELQNVTFRYSGKERPALDDLSFRIADGESVCVMGANGCGKSTLAKLVAGLMEPQAGQIVRTGDRTGPLGVGILFQNPDNQMVAVTVEKEIAFALENLATPQSEMETEIASTLSRFRIEHLRRRLTGELSGGEKQRLALASIMVFRPRVLVLDEPDSFLDETGKRVLREELQRIKRKNPDIIEIRITQYPSVAAEYERLVVLERGRVALDGIPAEILADHENAVRLGIAFDQSVAPVTLVPFHDPETLEGQAGLVDRIEIESISFGVPEHPQFVTDLTLELKHGEVLGLIGPSGAGKSTLGGLICGLAEPSEGGISYLDRDGEKLDREGIRGQVSALFQQPERQFFLPTCAEEIAFGPVNLGRELDRAGKHDFFDMVGLDPKLFHYRDPFTLSGGEKRRLAFAAILSMSPRFVVFDEPTCGLDQEGVGRFISMVQTLATHGVGMVLITHDGDIVEHLADRVLYLTGTGEHHLLPIADFFQNDAYRGVVSARTPGLRKENPA